MCRASAEDCGASCPLRQVLNASRTVNTLTGKATPASAIQRCNRFLEEMAGAGPGELVGQSSAVLFASPADWEEARGLAYSSTAPGDTYDGEWRFKRRDGSAFRCRTRGRRSS